MAIKRGTVVTKDVRRGPNGISKVYKGTVLIWPIASIPNYNYSSTVYKAGSQAAIPLIWFVEDGTTLKAPTNGIGTVTTNSWYDPTTVNIGLNYWVIFQFVSGSQGTYTGSALGVRHNISSSAICRYSSVNSFDDATYSYQIWNAASGGSMISSGTIHLIGESEP